MGVITRLPFSEYTAGLSRADWRKLLLACGVTAPLLWVGMDLVASVLHEGYSYKDQTISELSAIGASTRPIWIVLGTVDSVLLIAFAAGVWRSAGRKRPLLVVAGLLASHALVNLAFGPFSSMHPREVLAADGATFSDTLHLVLVGVGGIIFLLEAGLAAAALGRGFGIYSIATVAATLVFGFITSSYAAEVQANEPTPWLGIYERISAYGYQLWIVVLAIVLLRGRNLAPEAREGRRA